MSTRQTVVAFDFDGTLSRKDCVVPFLRRVAGLQRLVAGLAKQAPRVVQAGARRDRDTMKAMATMVALGGESVGRVTALAAGFADAVVRNGLRDDTLARMRRHREEGARIVIVSASYEVYLLPIGERLGVDGVLGTRLAVVDGRFTGRLDGPNCRADEKVNRLDAWIAAAGLDRSTLHVEAYGDSSGDDALAAYADMAWWAGGPTLSPWANR